MKFNKKFLFVLFLVLTGALAFPLANFSETKSDTLVLSEDNTVVLSSEVNGESVGQVIVKVRELDNKKFFQKKKPIYLFLNTPGGSVQSGLELIEALKGVRRPIHTVTLFSASMGFQIAQNLGERYVLKNGVLMSHRASGQFAGFFGGQSPSQLESRLNLWSSRIKELDEQTVSRTKGKQTLDSYQKAYANELWLTGTQAVTEGYADKIATVKCDESLSGVTTNYIEFLGLRIAYDLDACPINTSPMNIRISNGKKETVTSEKRKEVEARFMESFVNKQRAVVPMYW